jgi:hypothetical protein
MSHRELHELLAAPPDNRRIPDFVVLNEEVLQFDLAHTLSVGVGAFASGGVACNCAPLSADRRNALRSDQHDLDWRAGS